MQPWHLQAKEKKGRVEEEREVKGRDKEVRMMEVKIIEMLILQFYRWGRRMRREDLRGQATRTEQASATTFHTRCKLIFGQGLGIEIICRRQRRRGEKRTIQGRTRRTR